MRCHDFSMRLAAPTALLLGLVALGAVPAAAGVDSWTPFGPAQGRLVSVAASSRGDLYAVTAFDGFTEVWQLPAGTTTWRWRNNGLGKPPGTAIAAHPTQAGSLWAATAGPAAAIFRTTDAGATWLRVGAAPLEFPIRRLYVVPLRNSVVLFAQAGEDSPPRLLRSADGGLTWFEVTDAWGPIAASIERRGLLYARTVGLAGLVRSTDGGQTFQPVVQAGHNEQLNALHVTRGKNPLVFASFSGGLHRSTDGVRFELVGFDGNGPSAIASDPRDSRRIYAADANGFYTSTRTGRARSFCRTQPVLPVGSMAEPRAMVAGATGPVLLAGGDLRDARLQVLGESGIMAFGAAEVTVAEQPASELAVRVYLECAPQCDVRTFLSHDAGATFSLLAFQILPGLQVYVTDLAFDPAFGWRRLETSPIGTNLWQPVRPIQVLSHRVDAVAIAAGESLLAGGTEGVQRREGEAGAWETTLSNVTAGGSLRAIDLRVDAGAADRVLALALATAAGDPPPAPQLRAFRSLDAGAHWSPVLPTLADLLDIEPVLGSPTGLLALVAVAGGSELRRSDDGGGTSVSIHTFTTAEAVTDVAVDAVAPGVLYAASAVGVLRSRDGGATWESTPGTLDAWGPYRRRMQRLWVHPTERGHVFAAPADGGLFENRLAD